MRRALVTGGTGFIGRWCVRRLVQEGWHVCVVSSKDPKEPALPHITYVQADLLNPREHKKVLQAAQATHLLHLGWSVEHSSFRTTTTNLSWLAASIELIKAFAELGGERLVTAGSCMEYLWGADRLSEKGPCKPDTLYGACKQGLFGALEEIAPFLGLSYACGRIFFLHGPFEARSRFVSAATLSLLKGEKFHCKSANLCRDFLYVEDVADALVALLFSSCTGAINIGSGSATSLGEIVEYLGEKIGRSDLIELSSTKSGAIAFAADTGRLDAIWQPKFSLWQGIDKTLDWWRVQEGSTKRVSKV